MGKQDLSSTGLRFWPHDFMCETSVADPDHLDADPDPSFYCDADPALTVQFDVLLDPDPTYHFDAGSDPDPAPHQKDEGLRPLVYRSSQDPL
jgi:hypothetical protein